MVCLGTLGYLGTVLPRELKPCTLAYLMIMIVIIVTIITYYMICVLVLPNMHLLCNIINPLICFCTGVRLPGRDEAHEPAVPAREHVGQGQQADRTYMYMYIYIYIYREREI